MKLTGAYGGMAAVIFIAIVQVVFAGAYLASCELRSKKAGECEPQWIAAQALLFGAGGTTAGLFTRNPLIHDSRQQRRDEQGRFAKEEA